MSKMNTKDFFIGTLFGAIIGASAAMMYAPKSGKELRQDVSERAVNVKDKTIQLTNTAIEKGTEYSHKAKEKSIELTKAGKDQLEKMKDKTESAAKKTMEKGEEIKDTLKNEVQEGKNLAEEVVNEIEKTSQKVNMTE